MPQQQEPGQHCEHCSEPMPVMLQAGDRAAYCCLECWAAGERKPFCRDCKEHLPTDTHECPRETPGEHYRLMHSRECGCGDPLTAYREPDGQWAVGCERTQHTESGATLALALDAWYETELPTSLARLVHEARRETP